MVSGHFCLQEAIELQPVPEYKSALGQALYENEQFEEAEKLKSAAAEGAVSANKWLGMIAKYVDDDGGGANGYFTLYLNSNPSDAANVRALMNQ